MMRKTTIKKEATVNVGITETLEVKKSYVCLSKFNLGTISGKPGVIVMLTDGQAAMIKQYIKEG